MTVNVKYSCFTEGTSKFKDGSEIKWGSLSEVKNGSFRQKSPTAKISQKGNSPINISTRSGGDCIMIAVDKEREYRHIFNLRNHRLKREIIFNRISPQSFYNMPLAFANDEVMKYFKQFVKAIREGKIKLPKNCLKL